MKPVSLRGFLLVPAMILLCGCAPGAAAPPKEPAEVEGLVRVPARNVDTLYTAPGVSLANYRRLMLDPVQVEFKEDWQKRNPQIDANDLTRIRSQAGGAFNEIFGFALSANEGYGLTMQPGADVLRVSTTISDVEVAKSSGSAATMPPSYVVSSDHIVLLMDLRDSRSGALLARAIDRGAAGDLPVSDSMSNSSEARRTLESWAALLRAALDEARARIAQ